MSITLGPEWGEFVRKHDPGWKISDAFLEIFKQNLALYLAEREKKRQEQQEREVQKAINDYNTMKLMYEAAQRAKELKIREEETAADIERIKAQTELLKAQQKAVLEPPAKHMYYHTPGKTDITKPVDISKIIGNIKVQSPEADNLKSKMIEAFLTKDRDLFNQIYSKIDAIPNEVKVTKQDEAGIWREYTIKTAADKASLKTIWANINQYWGIGKPVPKKEIQPPPTHIPYDLPQIIQKALDADDKKTVEQIMDTYGLTFDDLLKMLPEKD